MMTNSIRIQRVTLAASLLSGVIFISSPLAQAQTGTQPPATATRPASAPPDQKSLPNNAPPAGTMQTTGEASHDPVVNKALASGRFFFYPDLEGCRPSQRGYVGSTSAQIRPC